MVNYNQHQATQGKSLFEVLRDTGKNLPPTEVEFTITLLDGRVARCAASAERRAGNRNTAKTWRYYTARLDGETVSLTAGNNGWPACAGSEEKDFAERHWRNAA